MSFISSKTEKPKLFSYHLVDDIKNPTSQITIVDTTLDNAIEKFKSFEWVKNGFIKLKKENIIVVKYY